MEYAKDSNCPLGNGVGGDVRRTIDNEFASTGNSINAPTGRKIEQATGGRYYPFIDESSGYRIICLDVVKMASRSDSANADQVSFTILAHQL